MQTILIIEDDGSTARVYRAILEKAGYEVEVSRDGASGFQRVIESRPDGVLLDLMLPDGSGAGVLQSVRNLDFLRDLPVIVYTHAFIPQMVESAFEAGATRVFDKSILTPLMLVEAFRDSLRAVT